jgi:hypothetical protein
MMIREMGEERVVLKRYASFSHLLAAVQCTSSGSGRDEGYDSLIEARKTSQPLS